MKSFAFLCLFSLLPLLSFCQKLPSQGDYIRIGEFGLDTGSYIFKKGAKVFFSTDLKTGVSENSYKSSPKRVKQLFELLASENFTGLSGLKEESLNISDWDDNNYQVIEAKIDGKVHTVIWDLEGEDAQSQTLNAIAQEISTFW